MTTPVPDPPPGAGTVFGDQLPAARAYARLLVADGVERGLLGPREPPRIWERHLLNSAVLAELVPTAATVVDVGAGAGLPGVPLALVRPDLRVTLVESLARRTTFLEEVVEALDLADRVAVVRARAEEYRGGQESADVVTARAVAPLDRLARWCLPLLRGGGRLLAVKGESAEDEASRHASAIRRAGGGDPVVHRCGAPLVDPPATVVVVTRQPREPGTRRARQR